jgi:hypothetical protein
MRGADNGALTEGRTPGGAQVFAYRRRGGVDLDRELFPEDPYRRADGERDRAHGNRGGSKCTPTLAGRPTPPLRAKRRGEAAEDDRCAEPSGPSITGVFYRACSSTQAYDEGRPRK